MTHEEYKLMLAEYALGVLDTARALSLEEHLATCEECRAELAEWRDTTAALAYSVPLVEPPAVVRLRLLESIHTQNLGTPRRAVDDQSKATEQTANAPEAKPAKVIPMPERTRPRWNTAQKFVALAASLAFVAVIIVIIVNLRLNNIAMKSEIFRLNGELQKTQEQVKREQEQRKHEQEIIAMFTAPDTKVMPLNGTAIAPQATARLAYNKAGNAMMIVNGLQPAPAGKDYQIWFIVDGKPMPGGVFKPDTKGHVEMRAQIPAQARAASAFAVTLEPQGGTKAPTGEKYLLSAASS